MRNGRVLQARGISINGSAATFTVKRPVGRGTGSGENSAMAANFFELQSQARRRSSQLVFLYACAVLAIISTVYLVIYGLWFFSAQTPSLPDPGLEGIFIDPANGMGPMFFEPRLFLRVAFVTGSIIIFGSLYKIAALGRGGPAIAQSLGGTRLDPATEDGNERKLLNIVDEMAIASGIPVPAVYVLANEEGINAFAAGFSPSEAVIGVTKGSLTQLNRDELQGVVAHEFSHILNGDMRLNLRLIGILHGILLIGLIGEILMRSAGNSRGRKGGGGALLFTGLGLFAIGYLGVFFGKLIKSGISRQREFLSDASAVQFTRNPYGLSGALQKILAHMRGSALEVVNAEQASHMFFADGIRRSFLKLFATHPPLPERIRRIDPSFSFSSTADLPIPEGRDPDSMSTVALLNSIGKPGPEHIVKASGLLETMDPVILSAVRNEFGARCLILGLIIESNAGHSPPSREELYDRLGSDSFQAIDKLMPHIHKLGREQRLPVVDLCMPSLRRMSLPEYRIFREQTDWLTHADNRISFFEYTVSKLVVRHLDALFVGKPQRRIRHTKIEHVSSACVDLLSHLAIVGGGSIESRKDAFSAALKRLAPELDAEFPDAETLSFPALDSALRELEASSPEVKAGIMDAAACCVARDGIVNLNEMELIRAVGSHLDCPVPLSFSCGK